MKNRLVESARPRSKDYEGRCFKRGGNVDSSFNFVGDVEAQGHHFAKEDEMEDKFTWGALFLSV